MAMRQGFTLIELSVVLAILGLLTGGIIAGQSLIRASEIRATSSEFSRYSAAVTNFKTTYGQRPGDFSTATSYWGDNATLCADAAITNGNPGTCNGNGNGRMEDASAASGTGESFQFWNQLALAGMIEGSYSGASGSASTFHSLIDTNVPNSKLTKAGWSVRNHSGLYSDAQVYLYDYGNFFVIGGESSGNPTNQPVLTPAEAFSIDTKMDDGLPAQGSVIARYWDNSSNTGCAAPNTGAMSASNYDTSYRVSDTNLRCSFYFRNAF